MTRGTSWVTSVCDTRARGRDGRHICTTPATAKRRLILHYITLQYITLHGIALHCIAVHCSAVQCSAVQCNVVKQ